MIALPIFGFLIIGAANFLCSKFGYSNFKTGDKDILFPFSSTIFLFFSLLIYLPQVHGKILSLQKFQPNQSKQMEIEQQQQNFPIAFLLSLLSLTLAVIMDKFCLNKSQDIRQEDQRNLNANYNSQLNSNNQKTKQEAATLKYFLTLSVLFINLFSAYFVTIQHTESSIWSQLLIFLIFSLIINFSYGFLLAWTEVDQEKFLNVMLLFVNSGLVVGLILGAFLKAQFPLVVLPCISIGFSIYASVFICFPKIFTNGQKASQDKFRYWAIFTSLLLTLIYYPILYLLKI